MGVHRVTWWLDKATQGYTGLHRVIWSYMYIGLHKDTQDYIRPHRGTWGYIRPHRVT